MIRFAKSACIATSLLALSFSTSAFASVDAKKFMDAFASKLASYGMTVNADAVEAQGDDIVMKGLKLSPQSGKEPIIVAEVKFENVQEKSGSYLVGQIAAPAGQYPVKDGTWDFGGAAIKNITIPPAEAPGPTGGIILYDSVTMNASKFMTAEGKELMHIGNVEAKMSPYTDGQPMTFSVIPVDVYVNAALAAKGDAQGLETLATLGFSEINTKFAAQGSWNPTDGKLAITEESFDVQNAGKLNFKLDLSGYTPQFVKAMQDLAKNNAGKTDAANGMAMMGLLQQLTLNSISIRFDDASLTGKLLDFASKQMGQPKEAIVNQYKGMVPVMAAQLQDPEFVGALSNAVNAFLDNPKSLEIKAAPASPIPFAQIMATGIAQPQAIIKQINLQVLANQ